ncbi:hypothetical protein DFP72DRAFT_806084, partial [Ephemerocybe angulata]
VQMAFNLHIRILWNLMDSSAIPFDPNPAILEEFARQFATEADLPNLTERQARPLVNPELVQIALPPLADIKDGKKISVAYSKVDTGILQNIKGSMARFGLVSWSPDLRQNAHSMYNSACRNIAINTFQHALGVRAYSTAFEINHRFTNENELLVKIYNNFVHHYMASRYRREVKNPGSVARVDKKGPEYKRRETLAKSRIKFIRDNAYPKRYERLIRTEATSEDERDPEGKTDDKGRPIFYYKKVVWRSEELNTFIRKLDRLRINALKYAGQTSRERLRQECPPTIQLQDVVFTRLPKDFPIEGYIPDFYNHLPPAVRAKCAYPDVILPRDLGHLFHKVGDEKLAAQTLMDLYRKEVWAPYEIIWKHDLLADDDDDDGRDDDGEGDQDDDEGEDDGGETGDNEGRTRKRRRDEAV